MDTGGNIHDLIVNKYNVDDADDKGKAKRSVTDGEYGNVYYKPLWFEYRLQVG